MSEEASSSDLDVLFPGEDVTVRLRGERDPVKVRVEPWYATQFSKAIGLMKPVAGLLSSVLRVDPTTKAVTINFDAADLGAFVVKLLDVAGEVPDAFIKLVAFSIGKPESWFDNVSPDDLIELGTAVYRQNAEFFARRVLPLLLGQAAAKTELAAAAGAPSSPDSSASATPESPSAE